MTDSALPLNPFAPQPTPAPQPTAPAPVAQPVSILPQPQPQPAPVNHPADPDDPEAAIDDAAAGLSPEQQRRAANTRLIRSREGWKARATSAETELTTARQRLQALEQQSGSVATLRQSLVQSAVRSAAASLVASEALEDTVKLIDVSDIVVGDDGRIDQDKVKAKVDAFVKARPHLAPKVGPAAVGALPGIHGAGPKPLANGGVSHAGFNEIIRGRLQERG